MSHSHPDIHWLTEYAAGNLPLSQALCISVHLNFCPQCRQEIEQLNSLGATIFSGSASNDFESIAATHEQSHSPSASEAIPDTLRSKVLGLIEEQENPVQSPYTAMPAHIATSVAANEAANQDSTLPGCLDKLTPEGLSQLHWKKLSTSLSVARLSAGDTEREVALHRIKAGGGVANHDHKGREVTVVLTGSFSDQHGLYQPGDFLVKEPGESHQPKASAHSECICLSVLEAPVKFTGPVTRMINPFLRIYPNAS